MTSKTKSKRVISAITRGAHDEAVRRYYAMPLSQRPTLEAFMTKERLGHFSTDVFRHRAIKLGVHVPQRTMDARAHALRAGQFDAKIKDYFKRHADNPQPLAPLARELRLSFHQVKNRARRLGLDWDRPGRPGPKRTVNKHPIIDTGTLRK